MTYRDTVDFERLACLAKYSESSALQGHLISPSPVHTSPLCNIAATTAPTMARLIAPRWTSRRFWPRSMSSGTRLQTLRRQHPPGTRPDPRSKIYGDYNELSRKAAYAQLSAAVIVRAVKTAQLCIRAIPSLRSSSRRGRPPDRSGSEEGRPTRTSIPARLAVRRGDRATA